jgi:hypothetical protein
MSRRVSVGPMISSSSDKKDLKNEITEIRILTLFFSDPTVEARWNRLHLKRHLAISTRFFFVAALFQGLFFWSDYLEKQNNIFQLLIIRLFLGGISLLGSFLVATGLVIPTQGAILLINLTYGLPSMAIYLLTRRVYNHWQSLYLVYGMCFFILPKVSPLNFMYAFVGACVFTFSFIVITAFHLSLSAWLLSNSLLLIVISLFCYDSYSSERMSRERWLLRDRLEREHINLKIVASSIQDDLSKTSEHHRPLRPLHLSSTSLLATVSATNTINMTADENYPVRKDTQATNDDQSKRFLKFFKGLIAWALCYAFGYSFDLISLPKSMHPREVNSSAAFALLMHSMGFSIFLLYFTGQIRWLALNGVVSLLIMFVFNQSGMSQKWVVFSTHSLGYVLLFAVIIIMILVFGGVVLVWHHLVHFVKDVLVRYPEVKDELGQNKVLESVLIRYIADMPSSSLLETNAPSKLIVEYGNDEESVRARALYESPTDATSVLEFATTSVGSSSSLLINKKRVLQSRRHDTCFFCLKPCPPLLVPACEGWEPSTAEPRPPGIPMCTPYTEMVLQYHQSTYLHLLCIHSTSS